MGKYFYPRSPCGERRKVRVVELGLLNISIHALLAESDRAEIHASTQQENFYPRSPCGERLQLTITLQEGTIISIHALLAESDLRQMS